MVILSDMMPFRKKMKNVRIAFEEWKGKENEIPSRYQKVKRHVIFEIKLSENF